MRKYEQCVCPDFLFVIGVNWKSYELAVPRLKSCDIMITLGAFRNMLTQIMYQFC